VADPVIVPMRDPVMVPTREPVIVPVREPVIVPTFDAVAPVLEPVIVPPQQMGTNQRSNTPAVMIFRSRVILILS
jgi:hypothetical protein